MWYTSITLKTLPYTNNYAYSYKLFFLGDGDDSACRTGPPAKACKWEQPDPNLHMYTSAGTRSGSKVRVWVKDSKVDDITLHKYKQRPVYRSPKLVFNKWQYVNTCMLKHFVET